MERDFDLIRRILTDIENLPIGESLTKIKFPDYDMRTIDEHIFLLDSVGMINMDTIKAQGGHKQYRITGLTWQGHDFLDASRDDSIWKKAKETVLKPSASITFDLLLEWLKIQVKEKLGLP